MVYNECFICCFILLLCGCSKKEDTKTEELLTNNDIGFTIIVEDGRGITKDSKINHINDYIGDQYIESKKNNDTVYYNDSIQITLNKKNKVKKVELFTDHYKVEGNFYVGLEKNNLDIAQIDHLIFHPGGKKILQTVESLFSDMGKNINDTKEVLRLFGNMSSATVLYVLERIMDENPKKGTKGLMLSFGPGFSAQRVLLQF